MTRNETFDAWKAAGVTVIGAEWHDDPAVEAAWAEWCRRGQPAGAAIRIEAGAQRGDFRVTIDPPLEVLE